MTYALRQQFQEMDRAVQADARQKLADEAATLQRYRTAELEKIGQQTPQANWELPEGYQFGSQNQNAGAPGVSGVHTGGGAGYTARAGVGRPQPATENESDAERSRLARQAPRKEVDLDRLANLRRQQTQGSILSPADTQFIADNRGIGQTAGPTGRPIAAPQSSTAPRNEAAFQELRRLSQSQQPSMPAGGYANPAAYAAHAAANPPSQQKTGATQYDKPTPYDALIQKAAQENGLDPALLKRLLGTESSFNPTAVNPQSGAMGIAQIMPNMHGVSQQQAFDPNFAIPWAAKHLAQKIAQNGGDVTKGVYAYKGAVSDTGRASVDSAMRQILQGGPQQAAAPQAVEATFSGMGPGGSSQMMQEQINLAKFRYQQLQQMLPYMNPEQQAKAQAQMDTLYAGAKSQQAYMLAARASSSSEAVGQLFALAGARGGRTPDGLYVFLDESGKVARGADGAPMQSMTGGQVGAYLYRILDEKSRAAQSEMQGKIALEQAKALAQAQAKLQEQGGTQADLEHLKALMEMLRDQNRPGEVRGIADQLGGVHYYNSRTGPMPSAVAVNSSPLALQ